MPSNSLLIRVVILAFLQVLVFDSFQLFGYLIPYVYILYIFWLPNRINLWQIILSFFLGLFLDVFSDSHGIHATVCVLIVYIRPSLIRLFFGYNYFGKEVSESSKRYSQKFYYMSSVIFLHHLFLFGLETFDLTKITSILTTTVFSVVYTGVLVIILSLLFKKHNFLR